MSDNPVKFLLVEGVEGNLAALVFLLIRDGLELLTARSGAEALKLTEEQEMGLVFLGQKLPDMTAIELAESLRGSERTRQVPIIFVTEKPTDYPAHFTGSELGPVDFISKPFDARVLEARAGVYFELARQRNDLKRAADENIRLTQRIQVIEQRYKAIAENQSEMVCQFKPDGTILFVNSAYARARGVTPEELLGSNFWKFVAQEDQAPVRAMLERLTPEAPEIHIENRFETSAGVRWTLWTNRGVKFDATGRLLKAQSTGIDITERKLAEENLRHSYNTFFNLIENAPFGVYLVDSQFRLAQVSAGAQKVFSTVRPLIGRDLAEVLRILWPEPFASDVIAQFRRTLETGERFRSTDTTEQRSDIAEVESYDWQLERVVLPDGQFGVVCYFYDMTALKRAEQALRESEERFRNMADHSPVIVWLTDATGACTYLNQRWYEFTGQTPETALGFGWLNMVHPSDRERSQLGFMSATAARKAFRIKYRLRREDGEYQWAIDAAVPRFGRAGEFLGYIGSVVEIDDQVRAAEKLERIVAERTRELRETNEQLEAFVYSIAHDLRAPLRSMCGYSQLLLDEYSSIMDETGRSLLGRIQNSSEFMDRMLLDLLDFGRTASAAIQLERVPAEKAWENALIQCADQIEQTRARIEVASALPVVEAHEATLAQCLGNLLSNALKFVPAGVEPVVRFWATEREGRAKLWIEDNGIGIPPDQHERIFRVFERVHGAQYPGTGIGLSIVLKGVERMGGKMGLQSEPGKGSRFWIELRKAD